MEQGRRPENIDNVVEGLLKRLEKGKGKKGDAIREAWASSVQDKAEVHTQPVNFKKGVMTVIVENSMWLYKLTMEKKQIIKRFNSSYTGRQKLEDIRFRVGSTDL